MAGADGLLIDGIVFGVQLASTATPATTTATPRKRMSSGYPAAVRKVIT